MKATIFARYSKGPRQTEQSIEGQVRDCQAYAKNTAWTLSISMPITIFPASPPRTAQNSSGCSEMPKRDNLIL